jgi:hypothetical protein
MPGSGERKTSEKRVKKERRKGGKEGAGMEEKKRVRNGRER